MLLYDSNHNPMTICLADPLDITRAGLQHVLSTIHPSDLLLCQCNDKAELLLQLQAHPDAVVVIDYTLFDVNDADELFILSQRFPSTYWIIFSFELTTDFCRRLLALSPQFSILLKDSPLAEIRHGLLQAIDGKRYICQRTTEQLLSSMSLYHSDEEDTHLTPTETEILKDIALGMTTREIAEKRISSFHTVNTHRKNIFRKLGVNNVHEAVRYALRAGLVDAAEYYI